MATKPKSGHAGTGTEVGFGQIADAKIAPGNNVDQTMPMREGFTRRVYSTVASPTTFGPYLAGGNAKRFSDLRNSSGSDSEAPDWDKLPGVTS